MSFRIEQVTASATAPLRQAVLRPHESLEQLVQASTGHQSVVHFAALDGPQVIGTALVALETPPWSSERSPAWRLRGMATAQERRNDGVGTAVLTSIIDHVRGQGGHLLWCNARLPAVKFYQRAGFVSRGEEWEDPVIGPHIAMELSIESS